MGAGFNDKSMRSFQGFALQPLLRIPSTAIRRNPDDRFDRVSFNIGIAPCLMLTQQAS